MFKSFLLKTLVLFVVLGVVLGVIVATMGGDFRGGAREADGSLTFFEQFVIAGGPIVWFVLLPMSLVMVYLAVEYSLTIRRKKLLPDGAGQTIGEIVQRSGAMHLEARIGGRSDLVSTAVVRAVTQGRDDWFRMRNLLFESLDEQASQLVRKIEWVNLIGNVSPMVGLFGTVFGMIKLFNAIVMAGGQPRPAQLAEGISVALVTTFWGLLIAIPALAIHGVFRNRIETLMSAATVEAERILPGVFRCLHKQKGAEGPVRKHPPVKSEIRELAGRQGRKFRETPLGS
jgi:biopolymer transport protein ExbB